MHDGSNQKMWLSRRGRTGICMEITPHEEMLEYRNAKGALPRSSVNEVMNVQIDSGAIHYLERKMLLMHMLNAVPNI